jgi:rhodanese-related sulfurtransferase
MVLLYQLRKLLSIRNSAIVLLLVFALSLLATDVEAKKRRRKGKRGRGSRGASISSPTPRGTFKTISAIEFQRLMQKPKTTIIDLRTDKEWEQGHIDDAIRIDYLDKSFQETIAKLPKNTTYLVYCQSGFRSTEAMKFMKSVGFRRVYELKDGFAEWSN